MPNRLSTFRTIHHNQLVMANKRHAVEDVNLFNSVAHLPDKELQEYPSDQSTIGIGANRAKFDKSVGNGKESLMISAVELNNRETPWRTTFIRSGPLSGIFCMLLAIASIVASFGILVGSNGMPIMSWSAPPSTYLAICTAIANLCMRYACMVPFSAITLIQTACTNPTQAFKAW